MQPAGHAERVLADDRDEGVQAQVGERLDGVLAAALKKEFEVYYPELELCTDNGAMIAFAAALRWKDGLPAADITFSVRPRWDLAATG